MQASLPLLSTNRCTSTQLQAVRYSHKSATAADHSQQRSALEPNCLLRLAELTHEHKGKAAAMLASTFQGATNVLAIGCSSARAKFARDYANEHGYSHFTSITSVTDGDGALASFPDGTKFDFVFIDAGEEEHAGCVQALLERRMLSPSGFIATDGVVFSGFVPQVNQTAGIFPEAAAIAEEAAAAAAAAEEATEQYDEVHVTAVENLAMLDEYMRNESRINAVMLPMCDGIDSNKPEKGIVQ